MNTACSKLVRIKQGDLKLFSKPKTLVNNQGIFRIIAQLDVGCTSSYRNIAQSRVAVGERNNIDNFISER